MDAQEISLFEQLKDEFNSGKVSKVTAIRCRDIWNIYHPEKKITYCMCSSVQRRIYAKDFLDWYEGRNR
jgi:hypothetical protein